MNAATLLSSWENAQNMSRANLLFENRNKNYGGYFIRVYYPDRVFRALIFTVFGFALLATTPIVMEKYFSKPAPPVVPGKREVVIDIVIPPIDKPIIPPSIPQQEIKKQLASTTKWITPKVVDDVRNIEDVKTNEDLSKTNVSTVTTINDVIEDNNVEPIVPVVDNKTYGLYEIQEMPVFQGGEEGLAKYLGGISYPQAAIREGIKGTVYVSFVVNKEGKVVDAKVVKGIGGGCDEEALRVVKAMPLWKPGKQNGNSVSVQFNLPVNFNLRTF